MARRGAPVVVVAAASAVGGRRGAAVGARAVEVAVRVRRVRAEVVADGLELAVPGADDRRGVVGRLREVRAGLRVRAVVVEGVEERRVVDVVGLGRVGLGRVAQRAERQGLGLHLEGRVPGLVLEGRAVEVVRERVEVDGERVGLGERVQHPDAAAPDVLLGEAHLEVAQRPQRAGQVAPGPRRRAGRRRLREDPDAGPVAVVHRGGDAVEGQRREHGQRLPEADVAPLDEEGPEVGRRRAEHDAVAWDRLAAVAREDDVREAAVVAQRVHLDEGVDARGPRQRRAAVLGQAVVVAAVAGARRRRPRRAPLVVPDRRPEPARVGVRALVVARPVAFGALGEVREGVLPLLAERVHERQARQGLAPLLVGALRRDVALVELVVVEVLEVLPLAAEGEHGVLRRRAGQPSLA